MNTKRVVDINNKVKAPRSKYFVDIEREIESRFILGLRETFQPAFEKDEEFIYNVDEELTSVVITPHYPRAGMLGKTPHIFMRSSGFSTNSQETFSNNFSRDISVNGVNNFGRASLSQIPFNATFECLGEYDVSRNLANKMFYLMRFVRYEYFSDYLLLNINSITKQPTNPTEQYPEPIFSTVITVGGHLGLQHIRTPEGYKHNSDLLHPSELEGIPFSQIQTDIGLKRRGRKDNK